MIRSCLATPSGEAEAGGGGGERRDLRPESCPSTQGGGAVAKTGGSRKSTEFRKKVEKRGEGWGGPAGNDRSDKSWLDMRRNEAQNSHSAFRLEESFHCGTAF